jgi:hypothetical protein
MNPRIPKIDTPIAAADGAPNSVWFRWFNALQASIVPDAPRDGTLYGRQDGRWQVVPGASAVNLSFTPTETNGTVNNSGGTSALIPGFGRAAAGLVPAPGGTTSSRYLREDGSWERPPGGGGVRLLTPNEVGCCTWWGNATLAHHFYDASSATPGYVTADNSPVVLWRAQSTPYFYNASTRYVAAGQSTVANQPRFRTNVVNGKSVVRFNGVDQHLGLGQVSALDGTAGFSSLQNQEFRFPTQVMICLAINVVSASAPQAAAWENSGILNDAGGYWGLTASQVGGVITLHWYQFTAGATQSTTATVGANTWFVVTCQFISGQLRMRVNGGGWSPSVPSGLPTGGITQVLLGLGNVRWCQMDAAHAAIFNAVPSDDDTLALERYFGSEVGVGF